MMFNRAARRETATGDNAADEVVDFGLEIGQIYVLTEGGLRPTNSV